MLIQTANSEYSNMNFSFSTNNNASNIYIPDLRLYIVNNKYYLTFNQDITNISEKNTNVNNIIEQISFLPQQLTGGV